MQKYKKYPPGAQQRGKEGLNRLRFVVDAEGNVLSYELVGRSGNADLDRATLDMIRRAQPLPKPPADMLKGGSVEIVASVCLQHREASPLRIAKQANAGASVLAKAQCQSIHSSLTPRIREPMRSHILFVDAKNPFFS